MRYIKKPVVIEAWKFKGEDGLVTLLAWQFKGEDFLEWPEWLHDYRSKDGAVVYWDNYNLYIPTLEGIMKASPGDYIIKGIKGEIYPCKPDIFEASYDPVDEELSNLINSFDYIPAKFPTEDSQEGEG